MTMADVAICVCYLQQEKNVLVQTDLYWTETARLVTYATVQLIFKH